MEFVIFEKKAFEEMAAKLENFMQRVDNLCHRHGGGQKKGSLLER